MTQRERTQSSPTAFPASSAPNQSTTPGPTSPVSGWGNRGSGRKRSVSESSTELEAGLKIEADLLTAACPAPCQVCALTKAHSGAQAGGARDTCWRWWSSCAGPRALHPNHTWTLQKAWGWTVFLEPEQGHVVDGSSGNLQAVAGAQGKALDSVLGSKALFCMTSIQSGASKLEPQSPGPRVVRNRCKGQCFQVSYQVLEKDSMQLHRH